MVGQPVGRYSWRGRFRSVLRWPAGASVGRCRQLREDDGPRRRIRKGRVVVGGRRQLREVAGRPLPCIPSHRLYPARSARRDVRQPIDRPGRTAPPAATFFSCRSRCHCRCAATNPLTWLRADCGAASAASQSPSYSADIRSTTPSGGVVEPAGRSVRRHCPRSRCETPDADQAWRSGRTRSTLVPSRRCPWRAADRRPTTGPEAAVHRPPPAARPP